MAGSVPALRALRDRLRAASGVAAAATDLYYRSGPSGGRRHPQGPRGAGPGPPAAGPNRGAGARRPRAIMRADVAVRIFAYGDDPGRHHRRCAGRACIRIACRRPEFTATERARSRSGSKTPTAPSCHGRADPGGRVRGIGNRPGAAQMNSGFHWPYGRREGVLPIWAHRRAAAPGAAVSARDLSEPGPEGYASRTVRGFVARRRTSACRSARTYAERRAGRRQLRERVQQRQGPLHRQPTSPRRLSTSPQRRHEAAPLTLLRCIPRAATSPLRHACDGNPCMRGNDRLPGSSRRLDLRRTCARDAGHRRGHHGHAAGRRRQTRDVLRSRPLAGGDYVRGWRSTPRATTTRPSTTDTLPTPDERRLGHLGRGLRLSVSRPAFGRVQRAVHARHSAPASTRRRGVRLGRRTDPTRARCTRWTARSPTTRPVARGAVPIGWRWRAAGYRMHGGCSRPGLPA